MLVIGEELLETQRLRGGDMVTGVALMSANETKRDLNCSVLKDSPMHTKKQNPFPLKTVRCSSHIVLDSSDPAQHNPFQFPGAHYTKQNLFIAIVLAQTDSLLNTLPSGKRLRQLACRRTQPSVG